MYQTIMRRVNQLRHLSISEIGVFISSWLTFLKWHLLITYIDYKYWHKSLGLNKQNEATTALHKRQLNQSALTKAEIAAQGITINKVITISEKAARHHLTIMNCLRRCLTQKQLLARKGIVATLHIGVQINKGQLKAHAWLSYQGELINDSQEVVAQYKALNISPDQIISSFK